MFKPSRTEPLNRHVFEALSRPGGWLGPDGRRYLIKHFGTSDGTREGMKYHVRQDGSTDPVKWDRIEKLFKYAAMMQDEDIRWFFRAAGGADAR